MECLPNNCPATASYVTAKTAALSACCAATNAVRLGKNTAFFIVALHVFGLEVFNGQLPSNAM
jgi:hypothetical protein